jgi:hypothetical protein
MKRVALYAGACLAVVVVSAGALALWLTPAQLRGLLAAGAIALVVQVVGFALLTGAWDRTRRFLAVWVGGTLVRFAVVGVAAWWVARRAGPDPAATLLGLAGYLFAMLLLEPVFVRAGSDTENTRSL